jgi:hypothetical protein
MIGRAPYAEKKIAAVDRNRAAVSRSEQRLTSHEAVRPGGDDADALFAWRREHRDLKDRVDSDREALAFAEKRAEEARAAEEKKAGDAENATEAKRAAADTKLVRDLDASIRQTAKLRDALAASKARTDAVNERRGTRPFIEDAEKRVRLQPAVEHITHPRMEAVWVDANGALCGEGAAGARRVERQTGVFSVQSGRDAFMPTRYADALRLFDLQGRPL